MTETLGTMRKKTIRHSAPDITESKPPKKSAFNKTAEMKKWGVREYTRRDGGRYFVAPGDIPAAVMDRIKKA